MNSLTPLEDATVRFVLEHAAESDGWLDLTRVSSQTGRMLPDVRQTVARLARRKVLVVDEQAENTHRWVKFVLPESVRAAGKAPPASHPAP